MPIPFAQLLRIQAMSKFMRQTVLCVALITGLALVMPAKVRADDFDYPAQHAQEVQDQTAQLLQAEADREAAINAIYQQQTNLLNQTAPGG